MRGLAQAVIEVGIDSWEHTSLLGFVTVHRLVQFLDLDGHYFTISISLLKLSTTSYLTFSGA